MKTLKYLLALVAVGAMTFYFLHFHSFPNEAEQTIQSSDTVYHSLLKRARDHDTAAENEASGLILQKDPLLRAGAAEALGYFDSPANLEMLIKALKDDDKVVRIGALRGLGHKAGAGRADALLAFLSSTSSEEEEVWALDSLARIPPENAKPTYIKRLVDIASKGETEPQLTAAFSAANLAPQNVHLLQLLRQKIHEGKNERIVVFAIRHLASLKDPEILVRIRELVASPNAEVRIAAIGSFHEVCPPNARQILRDRLFQEKDVDVLKVIKDEEELLAQPGLCEKK